MTIDISSNSFLEVADKVEAFKQQGYSLVAPIQLNDGLVWIASVTKQDEEEINVENVSKKTKLAKKASEAEA